jgi:hypothetical protein
MKVFLLFLFLFLFTGCASIKSYDARINPHVIQFEKYCNCKVTIPITIEKLPSDDDGKTLGVCYGFRMPILFRSIKIDKDYLESGSFYQIESTVFHELAHCVLDLEHTEEMKGKYIFIRPKSIMYPYSFFQYSLYREEYIKELFSRKPGPWNPKLK